MKIKLSTILLIGAVILILVMGGGVISKLLPNAVLTTPKLEIEAYEYEDETAEDKVICDTIISISRVTGATKYEIYVDDEYRGYTIDTEFSFKEVMGADGGTYDVVVRAVRELSGGDTIVSDYSEPIEAICFAG